MKTINLSWEEYFEIIQKVVCEVENKYSDYMVLAVPRGGLIPATIISYRTNQIINVLGFLPFKKYADKNVISIPSYTWDCDTPKKILIVSDIVDSGSTLFTVHQFINRKIINEGLNVHDVSIKSVVLIDKQESAVKPDYSAIQSDDSVWVNFPYEMV